MLSVKHIAILCLATFLLPAFAQNPQMLERQKKFAERFPQADKNKDGRVDIEEFRAFNQSRLKGKGRPARPSIDPTHKDIKYGEHELQAFDLYLAEPREDGKPTPLCIFIHGGGFRSGDKGMVQKRTIDKFHEEGISYAAMNYRLTDGGKLPYPIPMMDCARGLQTIRARAKEWNIDPEKIVCHGGSAGAGISMWLGFRDDLADPESEDPISRESTRILAAASGNGQSTYDMRKFREWFEAPELTFGEGLIDLYNVQDDETADTPRVVELAEDASPINHLSSDDVPVYMYYGFGNVEVNNDTESRIWVHHPLLGLKLQEEMKKLDLECVVTLPGSKDEKYEGFEGFLIQKLLSSSGE